MPYSRSRNRYNRYNRSNKYGKNFRGSKTEVIHKPVPRISTLNKKIKKIEDDIELKYNDREISQNFSSATASLYLLNGIAVGDTQVTRDGAQLNATSVQFRSVWTTSSLSTAGTVWRIIVFWDRQPNGLTPLVTGALGTDALLNTTTITQPIYAPYQYETQQRFRVLYDKIFAMNPYVVGDFNPETGTTSTTAPQKMVIKKKIKLNRLVKYDGSTASTADLTTNALWIAFLTDAPGTGITLNGYVGTRFYFKDA